LQRERTAKLLPGVKNLVHRLHRDDRFTIGLLTGNYPETGKLKVETAGLNSELFSIAAWGCDAPTRRDLTPLAIDQHSRASGRTLRPEHVVVIGDTPHDVDCAKAHGCRSIGVATGMFSVQVLADAGADLALPTLEDTEAIVAWMVDSRQPVPD
jgi:phosphoglycolate phosphatase-like HAD superfamily hydrolase